jgi:hypothetical protein
MAQSQELDWWCESKANLLPTALRHLEMGMAESRFLDGLITRLYYNQGTIGSLAEASSNTRNVVPTPFLRSIEALTQANGLRAVIETAASMLVRDPDFKVQTAGATWKIGRSARKLSQWLTGVNRKCKLPEVTYQVFTDACTNRVGGFKPLVENNQIKVERARPDTIIYADHEGPYSKTLGQRHGVPRWKLKTMFPKAEANWDDLPRYAPDASYLVSWLSPYLNIDLVEVFEGWHCSSGPGDPGRHVIVSGDQVLLEEEWSYDWPGLILYRWSPSYAGQAGTPLGEQLVPYQVQLQRMDRTITDAISKLAIGRVWLKKLGQVNLTDVPAETVWYVGDTPPIIQPGQAIGPEYYQRRQVLRQEMFELAGVSVAQSTGQKAPGLTSGVALREDNEIAYTRLLQNAQGLDRALESVAYAEMALADDHFKTKGYRVAAPGTKLLDQIDWKDLDIKEMGEFEIEARTMRSLPNHPSARAEMLQEWVKLGQLDPKRVIKLMGARDLETIEDRASIAEELAERQISSAIDENKYIAPEPYQGDALGILVEQGQLEYLKGVMGDAPAQNLQCLRYVIENARKLMNEPTQPAAPAAPPAPAPGPRSAHGSPAGRPDAAWWAADGCAAGDASSRVTRASCARVKA